MKLNAEFHFHSVSPLLRCSLSFTLLASGTQALERQKEYTDAIRIERDELREEVVKLKDILKVLRQCVDSYFILLPGNKYESFEYCCLAGVFQAYFFVNVFCVSPKTKLEPLYCSLFHL